MGGSGVEAIRGDWVNSYYLTTQALYVNMGDTYDLTLLKDNMTGNIILTSWGDWVERHSKKRGIC
jgi:hypothetical protein